jgi:hypothetical protein
MTDYPSAELAAATWLRSMQAVGNHGIAESRPDPWAGTGWRTDVFIVPTIVTPVETALRSHVVQVDIYARPVSKASEKPQWHLAASVAEQLYEEALYRPNLGVLTITAPGDYYPIRVSDVLRLRSPQRFIGTPQSLARYSFDVQVTYRIVAPAPVIT